MITKTNTTTPFTGFAKIKGTARQLNPIQNAIKETLPESFVFYSDKSKHKRTLYILTGKHQDKFLDCMKTNPDFTDLKEFVEKYLGKTAKKLKRHDVKEALKNGTFYV